MLLAAMMSTLSNEEKGRFLQLYEQYHALVYYIAYEILKDSGASEEVSQETFLKVIQNFKLFAGGVCPYSKNLIAVMAKNTAIDFYRKRKAQDKLEQYFLEREDAEEEAEYSDYKSRSTEEEYLEQATIKELTEALHKLSAKERSAIELHYYNHLKLKEVASVMGVSEEAVKKLLQRGLAHLRKYLSKENI